MAKKRRGKLELDWVDKGDIILTKFNEDGKTYPASYRQGQVEAEELMPRELELIESVGNSSSENMLIWGENLVALRSLEKEFAGEIKLIYIDPPFNTGQDFENYDDGLEHSIWLSMMENRLRLARKFLRPDGSIYVHLDLNEVHYGKILLDEIFGRNCFQRDIIWRIGWLSGFKTQAKNYIRNHDTILYYTEDPYDFTFNKIYIPYDENYTRRDGTKPKGRGYPIEDTWNCSEIDKLDSIQIKSFSKEKTGFITQKNENLLKRIIEVSSNPGDWVLDFFAGSGTTGAVAHKMGKKWIMVEIREDMIKDKALVRMKNVINGEQTGISKEVGWKGSGGFKFYKLGEPLIVKHKDYPSIKIINPKYYNTALIKVICNLEGFKFRKNDKIFHGVNKLGNKYAHVTEQYVSQAYIDFLRSKLADNEELIVYCFNYDDKSNLPNNVLIRKLPGDLGKPYQLRLGV